jgi:hypothetical protein
MSKTTSQPSGLTPADALSRVIDPVFVLGETVVADLAKATYVLEELADDLTTLTELVQRGAGEFSLAIDRMRDAVPGLPGSLDDGLHEALSEAAGLDRMLDLLNKVGLEDVATHAGVDYASERKAAK